MDSDREIQLVQAQKRRRQKRAALIALAFGLIVVAFLCVVTLLLHIQRNHPHNARLWPGDDHFESALVLCWFVSGVLAMVVGNSLGTPVRQCVFACAIMMTALALIFCLVAATG